MPQLDTNDRADASVTKLVTGILNDAQELIKQQFALFKSEVRADLARTREAATQSLLSSGQRVARPSDDPTAAQDITRRVAVIYNPTAGWRRRWRFRRVLNGLTALGCSLSVFETTTRGDAESFAQALDTEAFDAVAAAGGDGTVNEVANGLAGRGLPLAVIPLGTANVLAAEIGMPGRIHQVDLVRAVDRPQHCHDHPHAHLDQDIRGGLTTANNRDHRVAIQDSLPNLLNNIVTWMEFEFIEPDVKAFSLEVFR